MAYSLQTQTYNYETILNILLQNPKGLSVSDIKRDHGIHHKYDIKGALTWKGFTKQIKEGKETHFETQKLSATQARYKITKAGKAHLREFADQIQTDLSGVELFWKDGHDPEAHDGRSANRQTKQTILPLEEPIVLSNTAMKASEILNNVIASNHNAKTCIEEVHVLIAKYFESNEFGDGLKKETGIIGEVVKEALVFREVLESVMEITTESLTEEEEEEEF